MVQELPIELIGGPFDGRLTAVPPCRNGLPQEHLRVKWRRLTAVSGARTEVESGVVGVYERDMISDDTHRWRYVWCTPDE